jgi:hypothetical protein
VVAGLPLFALVTWDLAATPTGAQRFLWLFSYDYVYSPAGRPWPAGLDVRPWLLALAAALTLATLLLAFDRTRRAGVFALAAAALASTVFLLDHFMPTVTRSWTQKAVIARYHQLRRGPEERLIAYKMFWRGETFYTKNAIHEGPPDDRTVFDLDDADDRLRAWLAARRGQRHFFLLEPWRLAHLRTLLPPDAQPRLRVVDDHHNKLVLAAADL